MREPGLDASVVVDTELGFIDWEVQSSNPVLMHPQRVGASLHSRSCPEREEDQCARALPFSARPP